MKDQEPEIMKRDGNMPSGATVTQQSTVLSSDDVKDVY